MLGLWSTIQSMACIICCCAPVYSPLFPEDCWSKLASKVSAFLSRRPSAKSASPAADISPWHNAPLDSYYQGEGWMAVEEVGSKDLHINTIGGQ